MVNYKKKIHVASHLDKLFCCPRSIISLFQTNNFSEIVHFDCNGLISFRLLLNVGGGNKDKFLLF